MPTSLENHPKDRYLRWGRCPDWIKVGSPVSEVRRSQD